MQISPVADACLAAGGLWSVIFTPQDLIEVRAFSGESGPRKRWFGTIAELSQRQEIAVANSAGFDLYQGVNPRSEKGKGKNADITIFRTLCLDLDPGTYAGPVELDEGLMLLAQSGLPDPNVIVHSGSGLQVFWALSLPIEAEQWRMAQKAIIGRFPSDKEFTHADKCIHDPARVMRMPGTVNHKNGRLAEVLLSVPVSERVSPVSAFLAPRPLPPAPAAPSSPDAMARCRLYVSKIPPTTKGNRNQEAFKIACIAVSDFDLVAADAMVILREWNNLCNPPLPDVELIKLWKSATISAHGTKGAKNRPLRTAPAVGGHGDPAPAPTQDMTVLDMLARDCALIIGTTQVWHEGLVMSMPVEALRNLYPVEGPIWLKARDKRTVRTSDIVFEPNPAKVKPGQINLWRGLTTQPDPRPCPLILDHALKLCGNDVAIRDWLLKWMAYPLQNPGSKMDSAIIMQGPPGTGKSMFWLAYRLIFGEYSRKITQSTLEDSYTGWMSRKLMIVAEEVSSTKTQARRIRNLLKDWVTGEEFEIREKYQVGRCERALANFVFLSNEDVPIPIDSNDRRFCVISHDHQCPKSYFEALGAEIEDNGPSRLMAYLLNLDLTGFDSHTQPPRTDAKDVLKALCAHSYELFCEEWSAGDIEELPFVSAKIADLYTAYQFWCRFDGGCYAEGKRLFSKYVSARLPHRRTREHYYFHVDSDELERFSRSLTNYIKRCDARKL